jgi:PadR family transcriptional regulator AphA
MVFNMLKYALLGFLNYGDMTGYELKQVMDTSTQNFWHAKQSQIYMTLKKLEENDLVTSEIEPQEGRPDRRVYTITEKGRTDLQNWLAAPITTRDPRKERLLLKIFFSASTGKEALLTQLRLQRELHHQQLAYYQTTTKAVIEGSTRVHAGMEQDMVLWEATRRFGEMYEDMYTRWLDETIGVVEVKYTD